MLELRHRTFSPTKTWLLVGGITAGTLWIIYEVAMGMAGVFEGWGPPQSITDAEAGDPVR
jgi:hypothetical protein